MCIVFTRSLKLHFCVDILMIPEMDIKLNFNIIKSPFGTYIMASKPENRKSQEPH